MSQKETARHRPATIFNQEHLREGESVPVTYKLPERRNHLRLVPDLPEKVDSSRRRRLANAGKLAGVTVVSTLVAWAGVNHYRDSHRKGAATKAQISAMLGGHVPKGIESIKRTGNPDVRKVHYAVQPGELYESDIAANLHPMAIQQTQDQEDAMLDTYLPEGDRASHSVYAGEELDVLIDTHHGEILPNPHEK